MRQMSPFVHHARAKAEPKVRRCRGPKTVKVLLLQLVYYRA